MNSDSEEEDYVKRVLVTGGCGFVGYHLCKRLLSEGCIVHCIDNLSSGTSVNRDDLIRMGGSRFVFIEGDIVKGFPGYSDLDEIYHLACPASPVQYMKDPVATLRTCFEGTLNVLKCAANCDARVVYTSTSEIYGDPLEHPQREGYFGNVNTCGPRACYDEGKRVAETLVYEYCRRGVECRIVRLFNTYGPRMAPGDGRVIGSFIEAIRAGQPIELHNHGRQTRSFCYVSDTVDCLMRVMTLSSSRVDPVKLLGPYNIGNPHEVTIRELAETIALIMGGCVLDFKLLPAREDDPNRRRPDISRVQLATGWTPTVSLEAGLRSMIDSWKG